MEMNLSVDEQARATAALDVFYANPGGSSYRHPDFRWRLDDLRRMHAAIEAPTPEAALEALGAAASPEWTDPALDAENLALMTGIRERLR